MNNILLMGGGTQGLIAAKLLHDCGYKVVALSGEKGNYMDVSRYVNKNYYTKGQQGDALLSLIWQIINAERIAAVIPMGDDAVDFLCHNRDELLSTVRFQLPTYENFLRGYDKNQLMTICEKKGYPHPDTLDLSKTDLESDEVRHFPYPAMLKPNCTTGGRGMVEVYSYEDLAERYPTLHREHGDYHLQRFIRPGGRQVKIQLYIDAEKRLVAHSVQQKLRWYPVKGGSNTCAVSIEEEKMVDICYQILKDIDWLGFADFDTIEDPDTHELLIMELNPRLPACIKGSVAAGINWGEIIANDYLGLPQKPYTYKMGVYLRHLGLDFLWFLHAENRWKAKPSWFKFFGRNIHYQDMSSWTDPLPFIVGTWHNIAKLFSPQFKRVKQL